MFQTTKQKSTETGWIRYISYITQNVNVSGLNPLIPATPPHRPPHFFIVKSFGHYTCLGLSGYPHFALSNPSIHWMIHHLNITSFKSQNKKKQEPLKISKCLLHKPWPILHAFAKK